MRTEEEMQKLYDKYEHLIQSTISRQGFGGKSFLEQHGFVPDDIIQHGRLGLHRACKEYDSTKGASFRSFAINNIIWTISNESKKESLSKDTSWTFNTINRVSFDSASPDSTGETVTLHEIVAADNLHEIEDNVDMIEALQRIRRVLTDKAMQIVELRLKGLSAMEIGEVLGTSHQNVSKTLRHHKEKIKWALYA